jgi:glycosyltransferase involved in cell wall biosynthesis
MPKLSLTMIVKNEERYLEECLTSVKNSADEIIIVDTGSTDKTIEIAKKFNAQIYNFSWLNDFSAARNFALSKSTGNWILYLDADERISPGSLKELDKIKNSSEKAGYFCTVKSFDSENNRDNSMRYVRLFRNIKGVEFKGKVHEQITDSLVINGAKLFNSNVLINHLGYNIPDSEKKAKAERNLKLLLDEFEKSESGYYAFQLASTYFILEDISNAARYFEIAAGKEDLTKVLKAECYTNLALFAHKEFDSQKAIGYIDKSLELNREQPFACLLASKIFTQQGNRLKAEEFCKKAYLVNKQQLSGVNQNNLQVYLDSEEVLCSGFLLAIQNNNKNNFGYYFKEYKNFLQKKNSNLADLFVSSVTKLLSAQQLCTNEEGALLLLINKNSSEFFYTLLENSLSSLREEFVTNLYNKFITDLAVIKLCSKFYSEKNNIEKAAQILEMNRSRVEEDPAAVIYLLSYYLTLGSFNKVEEFLAILEGKYAHLAQISPIIKNIKTKINSIEKN